MTDFISAKSPKYRADIDGLRAIAVLLVLGFHAFPNQIKSGYIGVDIFFVISGFLITGVVLGRFETQTFSFLEFYSRRILRIFPALLLVILVSYIFGWYSLLPDEYLQLGKHIAAGAGFISNFILWKENGYFDNAVETKPLLHLWSLSIEEQFYFFWPLVLWGLWKAKLSQMKATCALITLSFLFNIASIHKDPVATFFLPLTRFWEILIGAMLACPAHSFRYTHKRESQIGANFKASLGCILIGLALYFSVNRQTFPGWLALFPTLGTACIIQAGPISWLSRNILCHRLMVGFGLISFPLYLWHWPLLCFARIINGEVPSRNFRIAALVLSIVLAWLTYRFIERPVRLSSTPSKKPFALSFAMLLLGLIGFHTFQNRGLDFRRFAQPKEVLGGDIGQNDFYSYLNNHFHPCAPDDIRKSAPLYEGLLRCHMSRANKNIDIAILGDSHAEHLFIGLAEQIKTKNIAFYTQSDLPVYSNNRFSRILEYVIENKDIKTVILNSFWQSNLGNISSNRKLQVDFRRTVSELLKSGKKVFLTDGVPFFNVDAKRCKFRRRFSSDHEFNCLMNSSYFYQTYYNYIDFLESLTQLSPQVKLLNTTKFLCDHKFCNMSNGQEILFRDSGHLNINGSNYIGKLLVSEYPDILDN